MYLTHIVCHDLSSLLQLIFTAFNLLQLVYELITFTKSRLKYQDLRNPSDTKKCFTKLYTMASSKILPK